jgi:hypothetical protein
VRFRRLLALDSEVAKIHAGPIGARDLYSCLEPSLKVEIKCIPDLAVHEQGGIGPWAVEDQSIGRCEEGEKCELIQ